MSKRNRIKSNKNYDGKKSKISLSSYDPITIEIPVLEVTEETVEEQMRMMSATFPEYITVTDRPIQPQDHLLISMATTHKGELVENLSYERHRITISDRFIPEGLKENLLRMSPGETKTIEYEAESGEYDDAENPLTITVSSIITVHEIQEEALPKITDEWVERWIPGAQTAKEFRERVRQQMEGKAHAYNEEMKYTQCAAALAQRLEGTISDELFEQGISAAKQNFEDSLQQNKITKEEYLRKKGIEENQLSVQFMMQGRQMIAEGMALEAMADHLGLEAEDEDINAVFGNDLTALQVENMRRAYERAGKNEELIRMARCGKALEYVAANALIRRKKLTGSLNPLGVTS